MADFIIAGFIALVFLAALYFILIKPQLERLKAHKLFVNALKPGDEVVTAGGIIGKVKEVKDDQHIEIEIAPEIVVSVKKDLIYEYDKI